MTEIRMGLPAEMDLRLPQSTGVERVGESG
jgi:hypothetical protein